MEERIKIKKQVFENLREKGIHLEMDDETRKAVDDEKLKNFMEELSRKSMKKLKVNSFRDIPKKSELPEIKLTEEKKVHVAGSREFVLDKVKEVYG